MDPQTHPDPFHDALSHGLQRFVQVASSVVTGAQAYAYLQRAHARTVAERDERARRAIAEHIRAERDTAHARWAPALDRRWLRQADLLQTARAWGGAMPYADPSTPWHEPEAATAMRNCEERLRDLHPTAMARYDRLRSEGLAPAEAMREAAFLFAYPPRSHAAPYTPRPALKASDIENLTPIAIDPGSALEDPADLVAKAQERRGQQIIASLQARARARGSDPLGEAEQLIVLETVTNLPADIIDRVVQATRLTHARQGSAGKVGAYDERAMRPWQRDFPMPIGDVVAAASGTSQATTSPAAPGLVKPQINVPGHRP
jgi:hypothetical protein